MLLVWAGFNVNRGAAHIQHDSTGGSKRRGQRVFPTEYYALVDNCKVVYRRLSSSCRLKNMYSYVTTTTENSVDVKLYVPGGGSKRVSSRT